MDFKRAFRIASLAALVQALAVTNLSAQTAAPITVPQGDMWTEAARRDFYSRDQGSRLVPWRWIAALKQANGEPFMAASLARYGYLPNEASTPPGLPAGFVVAGENGAESLGLTCAACHTRQIEVDGKAYRIDGGPAIADLYSFWFDLDAAAVRVLDDPAAFSDFAKAVLGGAPAPEKEAALRDAVKAWHAPFHAISERGLPKNKPWGFGRLDAVGMILNRLAGLDIGPPPDFMIKDNIKEADAPVRPPFLWNAWRQDKTQWPGFADNGDIILALARNLGQVYGVFGIFHPKPDRSHPLDYDYLHDNSANFDGLDVLEDLAVRIGPPQWPWTWDKKLAGEGKAIYERPQEKGGCVDCHGIKPGIRRLLNPDSWATPVQDVGTDAREYSILARTIDTGILQGARIPFIENEPLKRRDNGARALGVAVKSSVLQHLFPGLFLTARARGKLDLALRLLEPQIQMLKGAMYQTPKPDPAAPFKYEARVLQGIWAAAPYLHNGSVPTLAQLLEPAAKRAATFKIGPAYDTANVGLAVEQSKFNSTLKTTGCGAGRMSGDSNCGHEYGVDLTPAEKKALLEYLKIL